MKIEVIDQTSDQLVEAVTRLMPQLTSKPVPERDQIEAVVGSDTTTLLVAKNDDEIVGFMIVALFQLLSGMKAWVEDVVVDERARSMGVATAMMAAAHDVAKKNGATDISLTTRPNRRAAHSLYQKLGYTIKETDLFHLRFEK